MKIYRKTPFWIFDYFPPDARPVLSVNASNSCLINARPTDKIMLLRGSQCCPADEESIKKPGQARRKVPGVPAEADARGPANPGAQFKSCYLAILHPSLIQHLISASFNFFLNFSFFSFFIMIIFLKSNYFRMLFVRHVMILPAGSALPPRPLFSITKRWGRLGCPRREIRPARPPKTAKRN